ncbi:hypothetical protein LJR078_001060 [Arthrobacter sp. LjRoot78]|uniref:hypothetical protein n=1 Tax=Arthrobacter sp. LjRoot78 TaxID=3342338 RepID=UPI003ECE41C1
MSVDDAEESEATEEVELISDGEHLLVVGDDRRAVESFLRTKGLLERARDISLQQLGPALRSSAELVKTVSETVANSGLWVKLTPESAEAIKEFGLTDSGVPGVAYAMAGTRGSIKEWLRIDTTVRAQAANPAVLSGLAGALSQAARQQEVAQLRQLLETLDEKLDQVLRGQRDEILGDLAGIERELRAAFTTRKMEGAIDALTWSKLSGTSLEIRQVRAKAILKLGGIADDLKQYNRVGELNARLPQAKEEVQMWLSTVTRCTTALNEIAILELDHYAAIAPDQVDAKRLSLYSSRQDDQSELYDGITVLMQRMDEAAATANQNKIIHIKGVPTAIRSIDDTRGLVKRFSDALGVEVDWDSLDPIRWRAAIREWRQWKNTFAEGGSQVWQKGKPVLTTLAISALVTLARDKIKPAK